MQSGSSVCCWDHLGAGIPTWAQACLIQNLNLSGVTLGMPTKPCFLIEGGGGTDTSLRNPQDTWTSPREMYAL